MFRLCASVDPFPPRGNGPLRADQYAQVTADALLPVQHRLPAAVQVNGLMAAVRTGNLTPAAADALFPVELREDNRIPFQYIRRFTD